ncbi:MAG TPA: DUF1592 domain-containing protein [Verrucomicrobiae bacterium]
MNDPAAEMLPSTPQFTSEVRPVLERYCFSCHDAETKKGELNLERFTSVKEVWGDTEVWQKVVEQVSLGEMPPMDKRQPSAEERKRFLESIQRILGEVAEARAGDPGPVVLRRLNNAEYTYTVQDLAGVESLDPAKEFPADSAAGEGFMNTGASLVMSPALLQKYLDAAKKMAEHAVLTPEGFRFSEKTTRRDWAEEILGQIRALYARYTTAEGAEKVNLQGIVFNTNEGGRLPLRRYLEATIAEREKLASGGDYFQTVARNRGLSPKYLRILWEGLNSKDEALLLGPIRERWAKAQLGDVDALTAEIGKWQNALWKFTTVGHIGKAGGPKAWMEPVESITDKQTLKLKLPAPKNGGPVTVFLVATDIGDGSENDVVVWSMPRLVPGTKGKTEIPLKDSGATVSAEFGKLPDGTTIEGSSLASQAPGVIEVKIPLESALAAEFVVQGTLHSEAGREGSVQLQLTTEKPKELRGLAIGEVTVKESGGQWTSQRRDFTHTSPIIAQAASAKWKRFEAELAQMRELFPAALCYSKIVPVDEVVTLTLAHREDGHLRRLMLDGAEARELDRLWSEYEFVSQNALLLVDAFEQLWQYATQDADPKVFEPMRQPIADRAKAFRTLMVQREGTQVDAVVQFAEKAYRRPLKPEESAELKKLYSKLRAEGIGHEESFRNLLARVLVSPSFLYRLEEAPVGKETAAVNNWELATRLSYFLWSSGPDAELRAAASSGTLRNTGAIETQIARMLVDKKSARLAREFAAAWLHLYDFESLDEKSERHFPEFAGLKSVMQTEVELFFTDLFQNDRSVLSIVNADYTFVNEALAKHYGIEGVNGAEFQRVEGVKEHSRGGVLGMAATLAKQAGASRTSPILRGTWISEVLLGEKLPKPPKGVPPLPEDAASETLTMREIVQRHTRDSRCANCHSRIDGYGFAMEGFDAIGRRRDSDAGQPLLTNSKLHDGTAVSGFNELRDYLAETRRDAVVQQFCRKLLGYALGRGVLLSDRPLIAEMQRALEVNDYRFSAAVKTIVRSKQFREIRGKEAEQLAAN